MKIKNATLTLTGLALLFGTASGQWIQVTDFQGTSPVDFNTFLENPPTGQVFVLPGLDPTDPENYALYLDAEARGDFCNRVHVAIPLGTNVAVGTVATLKFDFFMYGPSFDLNVGLSPTEITIDPETGNMIAPTGFPDFEAQLRMGGVVDVRDGDSFRPTTFSPPLGEWMTVYLVIDHRNQTLSGYIRFDDGSLERILIPVGDQVNDSWLFRVGRQEPLINFYLGSSNSCDRGYDQGDIFLLDNIYIDVTGVNLDGDEPAEMWAGFEVVDGWADTGDFMGLVSPMGDFVYVWNTQSWVYLPEAHVQAMGAWAFFIR